MRKFGVIAVFAAMCFAATSLFSAEVEEKKEEKKKKEIKYVGVKQCVNCHADVDNAPSMWEKAGHSKAYEALATEKAKEFSDDPQNDPECLQCHVTGWGKPGGFELEMKEKKRKQREGVTCEVCHGPGQEYSILMLKAKAEEKTLDEEKLLGAGLVTPTEETCLECHNEESPTFEEFDFEEMLKKTRHGEKLEEKEDKEEGE